MRDLIFIVATYAFLLGGGMVLGYCIGWGMERLKTLKETGHWYQPDRAATVGTAFMIIHEWAQHNKWYLENKFLNEMAQVEHMRLKRDEPNLTLQQNLAQVEAIVRKKYPGEFQTLH